MSKFLDEKKNDLITRAEEVLNLAKEEKRELTDAEADEIAKIRDDVNRIKATMNLEDDIAELSRAEVKNDNTPVEEEITVEEQKRTTEELERDAFESFIRGYAVNERADVNLTKGDNGAVIPETIAKMIIKKVYDICPILEKSQKFNVKGKLDVPYYPYNSATNITVAYATEFSALESTSGSFASVQLGGFLVGALTKVSRSLVNNSEFDIVDFVVNEMAYAMKRFIEKELLNGTESYITGLSTLSNGVVANSASAITFAEIIALHDKVKDDYQQNAIWIMSPATRTALRSLTSQTGYPLLNDDVSTPFGTSILGKPVYVSDNMPDMASGKTVIYYGDMTGLATKFAENISVEVLRERYADAHAIGVIGWAELDAKVINEQKIAKLVMSGGSL